MKSLTKRFLSSHLVTHVASASVWFLVSFLLAIPVDVRGQAVHVKYTILAVDNPMDECGIGVHPGQTGSFYAAPGIPGSNSIGIQNCDLLPCPGIPPILSVEYELHTCQAISFSTEGGPNGGFFWDGDLLTGDCDGANPFTLIGTVVYYTGSIGTDACEDCLPADTNAIANVWYIPPGTNTPGGVPLPGPLSWEIVRNPGGASIITNGWWGAVVRAGTNPGTLTIRATGTNGCSAQDKSITVGNCSGCAGTCTSPSFTSPSLMGGNFGEGQVSIGSIDVRLFLGPTTDGDSAGFLHAHFDRPNAHASKPFSLKYLFDVPNVEILPPEYDPVDTNTPLKQLKTPQGLVTIDEVSAGYNVKFFALTNVGAFVSGGYTHQTNSELVRWRVEDPTHGVSSNQLRIIKYPQGESSTTWTFQWFTNGWMLTNADASVHMLVTSVTNVEDRYTYSAGGTLIAFSKTHFTTNTINGPLRHEIRGTGTDARTNSHSYYSNGLLHQVIREDGSWEHYVYDEQRRPTNIFSTFGNQSLTNNRLYCRLIEHSYDTNLVSGSGDAGVYNPMSPRRTVEYLLGQPVSLSYHAYAYGETRDIRCTGTNATWNASSNLATITKWYTNGFFYGQPLSTERPDGTLDIFEYVGMPGSTNGSTNIVWSGVPGDSYKTNIVDGTKTVTVDGPLGELISVTTSDIRSSGIVTARQLYGAYDVYSRPQVVTNLDGTWEFTQRSCCGDILITNREGTVTTKTYDTLNRLLTTKTAGLTHSNTYDAAGQVVRVDRFGTNGSSITLQKNVYNTAGKMTATTNAIGEATLFAETLSAAGVTNITTRLTNSSSGPQRIQAHYLDGRVKAVTGGLVHPVRYEYGPTNGGTFTKEIKLDANGSGTSEWTIQFYDTAGRPCKTLYADGATNQIFYNSKGQVSKEIDPDYVTTLYEYTAKGERSLTVLDFDRNGVINSNGTDRITWTTNYVLNSGSADVQRSETRVWATNNTDVSTLVSQNDSAVNGLTSWTMSYGLTTRSDNVFSGSGTCWSTNTASDGTTTISQFQDGGVLSVRRTNHTGIALSHITFAYDEHRRQKFITDARNGTTTNTFDNLDRVIVASTPAPGSGQSSQKTGYRFNALGQVTAVTNADNTVLYKEYLDSGELRKTYGSRTYPVEYTYDSQGRMSTMKTWQQQGSEPTAAVTTWNYDGYRGVMTNKVYADNTKPGYRYTPAGRLYQRMWARGVTTTYTTNAAGDVASIDYSDSTPDISYTYDRLGRRTTVVDGAGTHVLSYELDGRMLSETNTVGVLAGLAMTNRYDSLNRRTALGLTSDASALVRYGYDGASRLSGATNGLNTASYSYVANSPLVSQIEFKNNGTTRMTTTKSFDYLNRLTLITNAASGSGSENPAFAYANNSANQRTAITNADGSRWVYSYDALGQVTSGHKYWSDGTPVAGQQFDYTFDDIGNRKTAAGGGDESGLRQRLQNYTANNLNQYTQRTVPGYLDILGTATNTATVTVSHTATSRKGSYYRGEVSVANSASALWPSITNVAVLASGTNDYVTNWVGNVFVPRTPEVFGYDADGNMTNDGRWALTWDGENRLTRLQSLAGAPLGSSNRLTFTYDAQGRRISKVTETFVSGAWSITLSNRFVYGGWNLLAELNATNNAVINSFMWGLDLSGTMQGAGGVGGLSAITTTNAGTHFVGFDGNGNVAVLVSASGGAATANYEYDSFGNMLRATGPMALLNPFRFSTKYTDGESGFNYYGYRYYNAAVGRWVSRDPIEEKGGANLYGFCENDAIIRFDYLGQNDLAFCGPMITGEVEWHSPSELEAEISLLIAALLTPIPGDEGIAGAVLVKRLEKLLNQCKKCKNFRCKVALHPAHHTFPGLGKKCHIQVTCWIKGKSGSGVNIRIPVPDSLCPKK